jgi:hypothetical protein
MWDDNGGDCSSDLNDESGAHNQPVPSLQADELAHATAATAP